MIAVFCQRLTSALVILMGGLILSASVNAAQVSGLFESERPVPDQTAEARSAVVQAAMEEVLIKVSGKATVLDSAEILELLPDAENYLAEYAYTENQLSQISALSGDQAASAQYLLKMRFDSQSIMQILNSNQMPVWGSNRPAALVWLAIESPGQRFILSEKNNPLLAEIMLSDAKRRGLPVLLPDDANPGTRMLSVSDIWGQFTDRIQAASASYNADIIYSGRFYQSSDGAWNARWIKIENGKRDNLSLKSTDLRTLFTLSVDNLADKLASKYAVRNVKGQSDSFSFHVKGLEDIEAFARLNRYLEGLQITSDVKIGRFDQGVLSYTVNLKGTSDQFLSVLKLDNLIKLDASSLVNPVPDFIWQP